MKVVLSIALAVACLAAGTLIGFYIAERHLSSVHDASQVANFKLLRTYVLAQTAKGAPAAQEAALMDYLSALKRMENRPSSLFPAQLISLEEALTYARLSELAAKRSDSAAAAAYLSSAAALCPSLTWTHCSAEDISAFAARLDKDKASWLP